MVMARRKTLAQKVGVSRKRLSRKIAKVSADSPGLTRSQVVGKAAGILRSERRKKRKR